MNKGKPAHTVLSDGQWEGKPAFVIGGGPSAKGVNDRGKKKWEPFPFDRLEGKRTIGCNAAFLRNPDIAFLLDGNVVKKYERDPRWAAYKGVTIIQESIWRGMQEKDRVYTMPVKPKWSDSIEKGAIGGPCGATCINIAWCLGADPIYLIGFDGYGTPEGRSAHWHDEYPETWSHGSKAYEGFANTYAKCPRSRIINLSPESKVKGWKRIHWSECPHL